MAAPNATDDLVATLARNLVPVRRLRPPMLRAALWLAIVALLGGIAVIAFANLGVFASRAAHPMFDMELLGTLATGCLAVIAAFHLSLPDRSARWAFLPLPTFGLWLAASGVSCYRDWLVDREGAWRLGESAHCFVFILGIGLPLGLALWLALSRARPIAPRLVAVLGGLGAAALAAFLLQFFHPFDVTAMDLLLHAIAVSLVVASFAWLPALALGLDS